MHSKDNAQRRLKIVLCFTALNICLMAAYVLYLRANSPVQLSAAATRWRSDSILALSSDATHMRAEAQTTHLIHRMLFKNADIHSGGNHLLCPAHPPKLIGKLVVVRVAIPWRTLNRLFLDVRRGGLWRPPNCTSRHHVAIVIPYRDRDEHLRVFLFHMIPIFRRQLLNFRIFVIEQSVRFSFNRGMLLNIGFVEALKLENYECFVFSDVDLLPSNDMNIYGCPKQPRHLSVMINIHEPRLIYKTYFGGVENFRTEHFRAINGFSNVYFGWGMEDDELYRRVKKKGFHITRPSPLIAKYIMNQHTKADPNPQRKKIGKTWEQRMEYDGLNSLEYKIINYELKPLYTLIKVDLDKTVAMNSQRS